MNVLFVAAEAVPFAKTGGLADVVGSLPKVLRQQGVDARVMIPQYGVTDWERYGITPLFSFQLPRRTGTAEVQVAYTEYDGVPYYFLGGWPYFAGGEYIYSTVEWDIPRFIFFSQAAMGAAWELGNREDWFPDVFHVHDWHAALIPFLIHDSRYHERWKHTASMITIHNMGYQGWEAGGFLWDAGIPGRHHPDLVYQDKTDNLFAIGLAYADELTTVSPRYAEEIQYSRFGEGLEGLIRARSDDLYGILNGIDTEHFNPATDPHLVRHYAADTLDTRIENKRALQQESGLEVRDDVMLIGLVSRLVEMKGIDLAVPAMRHLLTADDVQFVALGTGKDSIEHEMWLLGNHFHWKARAVIGFDAGLAQRIYAGSDLFLMPSRYEPCGIGQMMAMRYGSLPLVRETGGLADTVENYDGGNADYGTGFRFLWETPDAVLGTLRWALHTYRHNRDAWRRMQQRGMRQDFSWEQSARTYITRYERALHKKRL
ncbi:MAG: glycogen synthase [Anaerolineae bacterium]|nr:glycogen synthase [Anaerolineae bacterium]